ncbi:MAG: hypothetical protein R6U61_09565 [Thermoplasmata archaeon]
MVSYIYYTRMHALMQREKQSKTKEEAIKKIDEIIAEIERA